MKKRILLLFIILLHLISPGRSFSRARQVTQGVSDSLSLVAIYNATGGPTWKNHSNWLDGKLDTWFGITVGKGLVTQIKLPNNNLTGKLPSEIGNFTSLVYLDLSNNYLDGSLPALGNLSSIYLDISNNEFNALPKNIYVGGGLHVSNNRFTFEDLEPYSSNEYLDWIPQKQFGTGSTLKLIAGETFTASFTTGGSTNYYHWLKNGVPIDDEGATSDTYTINDVSSNNSGVYQLRVVNERFAKGSLLSAPINLTVSSSTNPSDSLALVALYNAMGGPNWLNNSNWLAGNVDTWFGITVTKSRVISIILMNNNLAGTIPASIGDLSALTYLELGCDEPSETSKNNLTGIIPTELLKLSNLYYLNLSYNELTGAVPDLSKLSGQTPISVYLNNNNLSELPDLSAANFGYLDVRDNYFTFEDFELNLAIPFGLFNYYSQKEFPTGGKQKLNPGDTFTASFTVGGESNQYQWTKDGVYLEGATSTTYTKSKLLPADAGVYRLQVTNSNFEITLKSEPITLSLSLASPTDSLALVALYNLAGGTGWVNNTNWITGNLSTWYGVTVNDGRVTSVNLKNNKLKGTLPAALGDLTMLTILDLGSDVVDGKSTDVNRNSLSGTIPDIIGNFTNLTYLNLSSNDFTGSLPLSLNKLNKLQELWLSGNALTLGIFPETIFALPNLKALKLSNCGLTGSIPASLTNLTLLNTLTLNGNSISDLPNLTAIEALNDLRIANNKLTFEDLEPNIKVKSISYSPQDSVGVKTDLLLQAGTPNTFTSSVGGTANQYLWLKNTAIVKGQTSSAYTIVSLDNVDEGVYSYEVTNTIVPGLRLISRPIKLAISSLKKDSLALVQIFNATNGNLWTNKSGWLSGKLSTWNGVTISNNRVTGISLSSNNLNGNIPTAIKDIAGLKTIDLSNNKIITLPSLTSLSQLTTVNVSGNKLDFASLEANVSLLKIINYINQADIGTAKTDSVETGSSHLLTATIAGTNNQYQWKRNNTSISGASSSSYTIPSLDRTTMGEYRCEITNTVVTGLTIKSRPETVLAVTELSGKLLNKTVPVTKGKVTLFKINTSGNYDTARVTSVNSNGEYSFKKIVLDNYKIMGFADTITYAGALPTFYKSTPYWEEGDTLVVKGTLHDLNIVSQFKPTNTLTGKGVISGFVQIDNGSTGGRIKAAQRIKGAGVSARRVENNGRGEGIILTLVAFVFTDDNGEFLMKDLPLGNYRLNIQYPGYPMDEKSFINIPIGTDDASRVKVEATVEKNSIVVRQVIVAAVQGNEKLSVQAYPNPSTEFITIQFPSASVSRSVEITDCLGKPMLKSTASELQVAVDVRSLESGIYMLTVRDKEQSLKTFRIIIE